MFKAHVHRFVSYKGISIIKTSLVLVCCRSATLIFTSFLLQKIEIGLFKIYFSVLSELLWIITKCIHVLMTNKLKSSQLKYSLIHIILTLFEELYKITSFAAYFSK